MDNLEYLLSEQSKIKHSFSESFTSDVMSSVKKLVRKEIVVLKMWQKRMFQIAAACLVACLVSVYVLDGTISIDSLLGLSEYNDIELSQTYKTYETWEIE